MKINLAPICGIFKRHSPSMHRFWILLCREGFRTNRARFLCKICKKYSGPEEIKAMARRGFGKDAHLYVVDEMHEYGDPEKTAEILEQSSTKKPKPEEEPTSDQEATKRL